MHPDIDKTYNILFHNWDGASNRVEICDTVATIIKTHFGVLEMKVLDLSDMVQKYWFTQRDLTDFVELTDPTIELEHITFCVDKVLKQVLNLDAETREHIREALAGL
jgi:hypothetical protein